MPDEEAWEYACRAGTTTPWYCGDNEGAVCDIAWIYPHWEGGPPAVGQKAANAFGLYDMLSNVEEICRSGKGAVGRGGHAGHRAAAVRSATRFGFGPYPTWFRRGFRVAIVGDLKGKTQ